MELFIPERLKDLRLERGVTLEQLAEQTHLSKSALESYETDTAPCMSHYDLIKLAKFYGVTTDYLLGLSETKNHSNADLADLRLSEDMVKLLKGGPVDKSLAEQIYYLYKIEAEKGAPLKRHTWKRNVLIALLIAVGYIGIYLIGRIIWCDLSQSTLIGWLFTVRPSGEHSYLYGWLLSRNLFWYAMVISVIPVLFGKHNFSCTTLLGFVIGLAAGIIFGPYPEGEAFGHGHYGWAIWGAVYLIAIVVGVIVEKYKKKLNILFVIGCLMVSAAICFIAFVLNHGFH